MTQDEIQKRVQAVEARVLARKRQKYLNKKWAKIEDSRKRNREWMFKKKRGITVAERDAMLAAQGYKCLACGTDRPGNRWGWQVDHCHATGRIRGVLCHFCNVSIGNAKDNIETLQKWISYLQR